MWYVASWFAILLTIASGIWTLFVLAEQTVRPPVKARVSRWLAGVRPTELSDRWPATFLEMFDGIFGKKKLSLRFATVSLSTSIFFACALLLVWTFSNPQQAYLYFLAPGYNGYNGFNLLLMLVLANFIPDYLSNCQSRYCMYRMSRSPGLFMSYFGWLMLDFILTVSISMLIVSILSLLSDLLIISVVEERYGQRMQNVDFLNFGNLFCLRSTEITFVHELTLGPVEVDPMMTSHTPPYGVLFYSTFFTSIWLWVYGLSGASVVAFRRFLGGVTPFLRLLDFCAHPFRSLGAVCAAFITTVYLLVTFWMILF